MKQKIAISFKEIHNPPAPFVSEKESVCEWGKQLPTRACEGEKGFTSRVTTGASELWISLKDTVFHSKQLLTLNNCCLSLLDKRQCTQKLPSLQVRNESSKITYEDWGTSSISSRYQNNYMQRQSHSRSWERKYWNNFHFPIFSNYGVTFSCNLVCKKEK